MRQTERGLMLLCLPLGDTLAGALSLAQARELSKRARAIGIGEEDPLREVTQKDVQRLGYSEAEAAHIVALLNRERQLDGYLLAAEKAGVTVVTRLDARFPQRLREQLGARCPAALFCRGDMSLLQSRCISVVGSRQPNERTRGFARRIGALAAKEGSEVLPICAKLEADIAELDDPDEKAMFMEELGLQQSGLDRLIQCSYELLGLISFLTAGADECRAWTIKKGTKAPQAAGKIHSDFERGFIRAEVIAFDDLKACGTLANAKAKGLLRSEGKEYIMHDGDVVNFLFNV